MYAYITIATLRVMKYKNYFFIIKINPSDHTHTFTWKYLINKTIFRQLLTHVKHSITWSSDRHYTRRSTVECANEYIPKRCIHNNLITFLLQKYVNKYANEVADRMA